MKRTINGLSPIHPGEYIREALDDLEVQELPWLEIVGGVLRLAEPREDSLPFVPRSSSLTV